MKKKVLLVDDEAMCTVFLWRFLADVGYEVRTASSVQEAIVVGTEFLPDILVTDWMLKDTKNGADVAESLRQILPELHVIFLTGLSEDALLERAAPIQGARIVEKPVDFSQILTVLDEFAPHHGSGSIEVRRSV